LELPHTLLLVDDDVTFTTVVKSSLEKEGYQVYAAHHANEAMEYLDRHHRDIEVMLLDWSMPDITGIELLRQVKENKVYENIQVIMQTVMGSSEHIQQGIEAGAFFYLVKPVKKDLLFSTIRAAILDFERKRELLKKLKESERSFHFLVEGTFRFRTQLDGDGLAVRIANECPNPEEAIYISELFANAVEHGNAGLTYEEKTQLITENTLAAEVDRRLSLPENQNKYVQVTFKRRPDAVTILIEDMGRGFDFNKFLQFEDSRIFDNHGRGIAILNSLFPVHFMGDGNKVYIEIPIGNPVASN
jgi:CheY-like chemotaxis protein